MIDPSSWASGSIPDHILSDNCESRSWPQHFCQCWIHWILASNFLRETIVLPRYHFLPSWSLDKKPCPQCKKDLQHGADWKDSTYLIRNSHAKKIIAEKIDGASFHMVTVCCHWISHWDIQAPDFKQWSSISAGSFLAVFTNANPPHASSALCHTNSGSRMCFWYNKISHSQNAHNHGWKWILDRLESVLSGFASAAPAADFAVATTNSQEVWIQW